MIKCSIIGVTGYAGIELFRILKQHPEVEIKHLFSHSSSGENLADIYPQFTGEDLLLEKFAVEKLTDTDLVFTALPHGISQEIVAEVYNQGIKVIDLSGDFRYQDHRIYEKWYQSKHNHPALMKESVYGLVELNRSAIKKARLIANPGCYPTSSILGIYPLLAREMVRKNSIIVDAKSGVSGAGRGLKKVTHFCEVDESLKAYAITTHRHTSEIEANLSSISGQQDVNISFTPHLVPMKRGILSTIYLDLKQKMNRQDLTDIYRNFYSDDYFINIVENGSPETKNVYGSNFCQLGLNVDSRLSRAIVVSVIDNLGKGAASQAVQNMNIIFALPEETGLKAAPIFP